MKRILKTIMLAAVICSCESDALETVSEGESVGGSLASFTIVDDYLYVVNDFSLIPIDIINLADPVTHDNIYLGVGIETIFARGHNLFIGSTSAVYIFDIADPLNPQLLSTYEHSTGCDPVIVSENFAYVTLREGASCGNPVNLNVLEVIDVTDLSSPTQVNSIEMNNPRGLGIGCNQRLYVCDGPNGLYQFNITDPANPELERVYQEYPANDIIIKDGLLIMTGDQGIYQYSCETDYLELISILPINT